MRAWGDLPGDDPKRDREEKEAAVEAAGIDLDPVPAGFHRHADAVHASDHEHPHHHSEPGEPPVIGIVGAGAVGTALGVALTRAGWPVHAVASRDPGRRERFHALVDGSRTFAEGQAVVEEVELIILAVPDDAVASVAAGLRMYGGQAMVHTSGALDADVLAPAMAAGTQIGAFHPLVAFADTERAVEALKGATIAIEGDDQLAALLAEMAEAIGAHPVRLAPGSKAAYHAAAVLAAGGFVALLDAIAELGRVAGLDEAGALAIYGPLIERHAGQRPGARHPCRADRSDRPAATSGPSRRTWPRWSATPRTCWPSIARSRSGRSTLPRPVARWHRRPPHELRSALARADLNRYHDAHESQHRREVRGPAGGAISCAPRPGTTERRLGLRAGGSFQRRADAADRAAPPGRQRPSSASAAAGARSSAARRRPGPSTAGRGPRVVDALGAIRPRRGGSPLERRLGAVARLRTSTATSAGGVVVRYEAGSAIARRRQPPARARRS